MSSGDRNRAEPWEPSCHPRGDVQPRTRGSGLQCPDPRLPPLSLQFASSHSVSQVKPVISQEGGTLRWAGLASLGMRASEQKGFLRASDPHRLGG